MPAEHPRFGSSFAPSTRTGVWGATVARGAALAALLFCVAWTAACGRTPRTGPVEIKWDRQTCERCQMVISERRFAAQVRVHDEPRVHSFDDLGCALLWIDVQGLADAEPPVEIWVRDEAGQHWRDGYETSYEDGLQTPMQYGFGAARQGLTLDRVFERVRAEERARKSHPKHRETADLAGEDAGG